MSDTAREPLPPVAGGEPLLQTLRMTLLSVGYERMYRVPSRRRLLALPYESVNLFNFAFGRRNVFNYTATPWLYSALAAIAGDGKAHQLYTLFQIGRPLPFKAVERGLGGQLTHACIEQGILEDHGGKLLSTVRISPVGEGKLLFSDFMMAQGLRTRPALDVYIGRDSYLLMEWLRQQLTGHRFQSSLDLCCGSGIQTFVAAAVSEKALGTDVRPNAVAWARRNAAINGIANVSFVVSDLFNNVEGQFDLVTANFPYDYGQVYGIRVTMEVLRQLDRYLAPGGEFYGTTLSWVDRTGTDVLVDAVKTELREAPLDLELIPIQYSLNYVDDDPAGDREYVQRMGIVKGIQYLIRAKRRSHGRLSFNKHLMSHARALFWNLYVAVLKGQNKYRSYRRPAPGGR
jgi:SAM-dependent methyltransferase